MCAESRPVAWVRLQGLRLCEVLRYVSPVTDFVAPGNVVPAVVGLIVPRPVVSPALAGVSLELHGGASCGLTILAVSPCPEPERGWQVLAELAS